MSDASMLQFKCDCGPHLVVQLVSQRLMIVQTSAMPGGKTDLACASGQCKGQLHTKRSFVYSLQRMQFRTEWVAGTLPALASMQ